jgi:hypothetical protein
MGIMKNAYRNSVGNPEGKRPLGRHIHRWKDNIKMYLKAVYEGEGWIHLTQDKKHLLARTQY